MKRKDFTLLAMIAVVSAIFSFILSNALISSDSNRSQQVEVVQPISTEFPRPPQDYFNDKAVNPTQLIEIGPQNTDPFRSE